MTTMTMTMTGAPTLKGRAARTKRLIETKTELTMMTTKKKIMKKMKMKMKKMEWEWGASYR
jgi:hypothetical protein